MESGEPNIGLTSSSQTFFRTRKKLRKRRKASGTASGMIHEKNIEKGKHSRKASNVPIRTKRGRRRQVFEDCSLNSFLDWCQKRLSKENFANEEEFTIGGNGIRPFPRKENNKSLERNFSKNHFPNYHSSSRRKISPGYLVPMPRGSKIKLDKDRANNQFKRYPSYFEEENGRTVANQRKISSKQYEAHLLFPKSNKEREVNIGLKTDGGGKNVNFAKCKLYLTPRKPSGPLRLYLEPVKGYNTLFLKAEIPYTKKKVETRGGGIWDVFFNFLKIPFSRGNSQSPH